MVIVALLPLQQVRSQTFAQPAAEIRVLRQLEQGGLLPPVELAFPDEQSRIGSLLPQRVEQARQVFPHMAVLRKILADQPANGKHGKAERQHKKHNVRNFHRTGDGAQNFVEYRSHDDLLPLV